MGTHLPFATPPHEGVGPLNLVTRTRQLAPAGTVSLWRCELLRRDSLPETLALEPTQRPAPIITAL